MTDPFDRLRQPVEPLPPPAGTFDLLLARAHRRRTARTTLLAALVAVVLSVGGGFTLTAGRQDSSGRLIAPVTGASGTPSPSANSPSAKGAPPSPRTPTTRGGVPIPPEAVGGPVPRGFLPYSFTSVGGGVTYLLGDAPCRTAPCTSVVRSTDGGRTWVGLPAPRAPLPRWQDGRLTSGSSVRDLRFASPRDGWAYGGALFATHDGSRTWRPVDIGGSVLDLATDGTTTYAVVATCDAQGFSCSNARLRSTPVTSDRWHDVPGVDGANYGQLSVSGDQGVALMVRSSGDARLFVRSGSQWRPVTPPCGTRLSGATASASSPRLFAFCGAGAAGSLYLLTYISDEAGGNWRRRPGSPLQLANGTLLVTAAATSNLVLAASLGPDFPNPLARSGDGGRSWADAGAPYLQGGWRYVGASSASSLVGLPGKPDGSVWTSRDGGLRWAAYRFR